jgi:hypothetical protein
VVALAAVLVVLASRTAHAEDESAPPPQPPPANKDELSIRALGGVAHGALFGTGATGPALGLGFGAESRRSWGGFEGYGAIRYEPLQTTYGVGLHRTDVEATLNLHLSRFFIGGGPHAGMLAFEDLSATSSTPKRVLVGLHANAGVDLFTVDRATFFVAARGDADWVFKTTYLEASAFAGIKLRVR